jgi:hypothetical protein
MELHKIRNAALVTLQGNSQAIYSLVLNVRYTVRAMTVRGLTRREVDDVTAFLGVRWPHTLVLGSVTLDPVIYIQVGYATTHITDSCRHRRGRSNWAHCCACLD